MTKIHSQAINLSVRTSLKRPH